jgi:hypothetical protein
MDADSLRDLRRLISSPASRRGVLASLGGGFLAGLVVVQNGDDVAARRRRKKRRKASLPTLNAFGCVSVGQACAGSDDLCCSGVCDGEKPGKGKKDQSRCAARNALDCLAGADSCLGLGVVTCGAYGYCQQTTGGASFCAGFAFADCSFSCSRDADCVATMGPGAACVVCPGGCPESPTLCLPAGT